MKEKEEKGVEPNYLVNRSDPFSSKRKLEVIPLNRQNLLSNILKYLVPASLIVVGVIHLIPLSGAFGVGRLNSLYGISITDADLAILMRHRAVLFGLLGLFLVYAAVKPPLRLIALAAAAVSVGSFLYLAYATGGYNEELKRVVVADLVAAAFLATGFAGYFVGKSGNSV